MESYPLDFPFSLLLFTLNFITSPNHIMIHSKTLSCTFIAQKVIRHAVWRMTHATTVHVFFYFSFWIHFDSPRHSSALSNRMLIQVQTSIFSSSNIISILYYENCMKNIWIRKINVLCFMNRQLEYNSSQQLNRFRFMDQADLNINSVICNIFNSFVWTLGHHIRCLLKPYLQIVMCTLYIHPYSSWGEDGFHNSI